MVVATVFSVVDAVVVVDSMAATVNCSVVLPVLLASFEARFVSETLRAFIELSLTDMESSCPFNSLNNAKTRSRSKIKITPNKIIIIKFALFKDRSLADISLTDVSLTVVFSLFSIFQATSLLVAIFNH